MRSKIDHSLLPAAVRDSLDPELLNQAHSIEWSIDRDDGRNEHGFLGDKSDNYGPGKTNSTTVTKKTRKVEWFDYNDGRTDSGYERTPTSLSTGQLSQQRTLSSLSNQRVDLSPLDESLDMNYTNSQAPVGYPQANKVIYDRAPHANPGQRTVYYEKSSRVLSQEEVDALGLDPDSYAKLMSRKAATYSMPTRARSVSPVGTKRGLNEEPENVTLFGSMEELNTREQEFYPYRDAHQGKVN